MVSKALVLLIHGCTSLEISFIDLCMFMYVGVCLYVL